jgi:hypothetical protein
MRNEMKIEIVINATLDIGYLTAIDSTPTEQAEHLVQIIAAQLFGEDFATLLMGTVRIEARDPAIYPNAPNMGRLHTEVRNEVKGFDTPDDIAARFGEGYRP